MKLRTLLLAACCALAFTPASAEPDGASTELPPCGSSMPISRAMVSAMQAENRFIGAALKDGGALLVGVRPSPELGTIAFVRRGGAWRAFSVQELAAPVGLYRSTRTGNAFVWTMHSAEGPGDSFTGLYLPAGGAGLFCTNIPFPPSLNKPSWAMEFLELKDFNIAPSGRGGLVGTAEVERGGSQVIWTFRYSTGDYGRRWSRPARVSSAAPVPGTYEAIGEEAPADLVADLVRHSR